MDFEKSYFVREFELVVAFEVDYYDCSFGNTGIGHYEYWGAPCYDKGTDYVEEYEATDLVVWSERRKDMVKPSNRLAKVLFDKIYGDDDARDELMESIVKNSEREY